MKTMTQSSLDLEVSEKIAEQQLRTKLKSQSWRLNNLYYIKNKQGQKIKFKPNVFQEVVYRTMWFCNIILKARQLGITTFFCILYLDFVLFHSNQTAGIIAHTEKDAKKIFKEKIKFAFDNLPISLRTQLEIKTDSTEELSFKNGSSIFVSVSTRSGTVQYLHISEFGYTCKKFPEKAIEIITGALNSVEQGQMVSIESTAKGRSGAFYDMCKTAQDIKRKQGKLTELDYKFFFFAWWENLDYTLDSDETLPQEMLAYFEKLYLENDIKLTNGQKHWYYSKSKTQKSNMMSEFPSTPEEAFLAANEGTYYGKQIAKTILDKRVSFVPHDPKLLVDTYWDLGLNDYNVILFVQTVGKEIRFIDLYYNHLEGLPHYANVLKKKRDDEGYHYGRHFLPHDVEVTELSSGTTRKHTLQGLGVVPLVVVPKLGIAEGIDMVRNIFGRFWIDEQKCDKLIQAMENYSQEYDEKLEVGKDKPRHDEWSHFADALRYLGVMFRDSASMDDMSSIMTEGEKYGLFPTLGQ